MYKKYKEKLSLLKPSEAIEGKQKHFTGDGFFEKLLNFSKKMGIKLSYYSLLLFYAFKSENTPKSAKLTIAGALGYLILPIDLIPDMIPVIGFADDTAVIIYAVYKVIGHIDDDIKRQAHKRMVKIFGESYFAEDGSDDIDEKLKPEL